MVDYLVPVIYKQSSILNVTGYKTLPVNQVPLILYPNAFN